MDEYHRLFQFWQLPQSAIDISRRRIILPLPGTEGPFDTYGFVPALLPLWSGQGPKYTGYWKHWFGLRRMTIVDVTVENNRRTRETARTFDQLACEVVLAAVEHAEELTPKIRAFGAHVGLSTAEVEQIGQIWRLLGEEPAGLLSLPLFSSDPPFICLEGDYTGYTGDFPHDEMRLDEETLRNMCTTETSRELYAHITTLDFAPPWFTTAEQAPLFQQLLREKDYLGAWMSLNSTSWRFLEAKEALRQLAQESRVPGLDLLAEAWAAIPHEKNGVTPETASY